jgi:small-conductance mechanosensitive channel
MTTPIHEKEQYVFPPFAPDRANSNSNGNSNILHNTTRYSDELKDDDGTLKDDPGDEYVDRNHLRLHTSYDRGQQEHLQFADNHFLSPSQERERSSRLDDDLELLRAERVVSDANALAEKDSGSAMGRSRSMNRSRSRTAVEPLDDFDVGTTPIHEKTKIYQPPENPANRFAKIFKKIHNSSFLVRYFCYITPVTVVLLAPLLLGLLVFPNTTVGDVRLLWFSVWLEIFWLSLWLARIIAKCLPYPMGVISSLFTNNDKKWRDLGKMLELPATLFFWGLACEISFLPTMVNHHFDGDTSPRNWEVIFNKIIIGFLIGTVLNFIEKLIIQLIAISFHLRTYADRIEVNKFQIGSLLKLYVYSKEKIAMEDFEFEDNSKSNGPSGARTPMAYINKAGKNARQAFNRVGDVAGKVAGDFTGKEVTSSTHPQQVVLQLLGTTSGSQVLARRLYRTYAHPDNETAVADDLRPAFENNEEADAAFTMFDKDLNGDISMEELEAVCVEIGRERKAITASLKDLDSVVSKLDDILFFIVAIITVVAFISIISTSASGVLQSLGSSLLALSWLFSATAQEFLQSVIFVFVKHPFDVGDRVTIYGNTGAAGKGDDYFVKEISLLYTEFKKMEGHVVQAPNSYLNTLFILNQRRSGGLAEAVPVTVKFGTTLEQLETLRNRLLEFVTSENREYQSNILTELTTVYEAYSISLNVVFFYKSNWQNELLRLQRRNKFICALMVTMQDLGIEGPRQKLAGQSAEMPVYLHGAFQPKEGTEMVDSSAPIPPSAGGPQPRSGSIARDAAFVPSVSSPAVQPQPFNSNHGSILRNRMDSRGQSVGVGRGRHESVSQMGRRVDFSLGMSSISSGADLGDVYDEPRMKIPIIHTKSPSPARSDTRRSIDSENLARTTSRESAGRGSTQGAAISSSGSHRNRFFGRGRPRVASMDDGSNLQDLEEGVGPGPGFSVKDMPDIPEASGATSPPWEMQTLRNMSQGSRSASRLPGARPIDPPGGIVSPQTVAGDSSLMRRDIPARVGNNETRR